MLCNCSSVARRRARKEKKNRDRWCKDWYLQRSILPSDNDLLNELHDGREINDYRNYLRMDENEFQILLKKVTPFIEKKDTVLREAISPRVRLIATLRFLATGRSFEDLKFSMRVSPQALGKIIIETCVAIRKSLQNCIQVSIR